MQIKAFNIFNISNNLKSCDGHNLTPIFIKHTAAF